MKNLKLPFTLAATLAAATLWGDTETVDGYTWTYTVSSGKASVGGGSYSSPAIPTATSGAIIIPSTLGGKPVTSIGSCAFHSCSGLTSITIPDSVTSIGNDAFFYCSGLTSITIPDSVTSIGSYAFNNCTKLSETRINVSDMTRWATNSINSQLTMRRRLFIDGVEITNLVIPDGVTNIGAYAFYYCTNLTSVAIPDSVTSIGSYAFYGCSGLTSITIPDSVTSIGNDAFSYCSGLTSVTVPDSVTNIGERAFYNCSGLTSVTIPSSVTSIGWSVFSGCSGLTSVTIPSSVTSIGSYAFSGCSGLTSLTIPASVTSIGWSVFSGCSGLTSVTVPDSVTNIGERAFYNCSGLTSITIPDSVTSIGSYAFNNCSNLVSITFPASVTSIGSYAFSGCSGLTSLTIPASVTSIGYFAFSGCSGLTSVMINEGVTEIGHSAFSGCSGLTSVTIPGSVKHIGNVFPACSGLTSVTIAEGARSIEGEAFYGYSGLTSVIIPNSVTSIGGYAFSDCNGLTSITIPDSVTSIGEMAFYNCTNLTYVTIAEGVRSIGDFAFSGCSGLSSVTIPDSVTYIGQDAFSGCSGLTSFVVDAGNSRYTSANGLLIDADGTLITGKGISGNVTIPDGVTSIGDYAFNYCGSLTSVTIPDSVTSLGDCAFADCANLTIVTMTDSITKVGDAPFLACNNLKETHILISNMAQWASNPINEKLKGVRRLFADGQELINLVIPDGTTHIGEYAFSYCTNLVSITIPDSVTSIGSNAFYGCPASLFDTTTIPGLTLVDGWVVGCETSLSCYDTLNGIRGIAEPLREQLETSVVEFGGGRLKSSAIRAWDDLQINVAFDELEIPESETTVSVRMAMRGSGEATTNFTFTSAVKDGAILAVVLTDLNINNLVGYSVSISNSLFSGTHDFGWQSIPEELDIVATFGCGGLYMERGYNHYSGKYVEWWNYYGWHDCFATSASGAIKIDYGLDCGQAMDADSWNATGWNDSDEYSYNDSVWGMAEYQIGQPGEIGISMQYEEDGEWTGNETIKHFRFDFTTYILPGGAPGVLYTTLPIIYNDIGNDEMRWERWYPVRYYHSWPAGNGEEDYKCYYLDNAYLTIPPYIETHYVEVRAENGLVVGYGNDYDGSLNDVGAIYFWVDDGDRWARCLEKPRESPYYFTDDSFGDFYGSSYGVSAMEGYYICEISGNGYIKYDFDGNIVSSSWPAFGAVWENMTYTFIGAPIPYTITFVDKLGAENPNETTYTVEDCYEFLPPAEVEGWDFIGWDVSGVDHQSGDITVTAQWRQSDRQVTFDVGAHGSRTGGGELSQTVVWGEAAVPPEIKADTDWVFAGWDADISRVTESMTVTALYERPPLPFSKASGLSGVWISGGDAEWFTEWTEEAHDGTNHLHSGTIGDGQVSWVETTVSDPGVLSFWWRASSEQYGDDIYDFAFLSVDGEPLGWLDDNYRPQGVAIGGATGWTNVVVEISGDGSHTIRWTYAKDEMDDGDVGEDCAWLDEVSFIPTITLSFDIGEGTGAAPDSFQPLPGDVVALPAATGFTRARHTFAGWSDGTTTWTAGAQYTVGWTSVAFTAVWAANTLEAPTISSADVADGGVHEAAFATIRIEAEPGTAIHYMLDGTAPTAGSPRYTAPFAADGMAVTVRAIAVKDDFFDSPVAEFSFTRKPYGAAECLDAVGGVVSTGGEDAPWTRVLGEAAHDGVAAMRSGEIGDNGTSTVAMSVNGAGEVGFWWKVSSEISHNRKMDYVSFTVDGMELGWLGGDKGWTNEVHAVTGGGTHTLKWTYQKNGNGKTMGEDCAWLDEVTWTPAAESGLPQLATNAAPEAVTNAIASAGFVQSVAATLQDAIGGDAEKYNEFKTWAHAVTNGDGEAAGEAAVVASERAAISYLLGTDTLIANDIESDDVHITGFSIDHGAESGGGEMQFSFEVAIDGVAIGSSDAIGMASLKENLRKAIGVEGATRLDGEFSSANIELTFDAPVDGKARFIVTPPPDAGTSFFMRAMVQ